MSDRLRSLKLGVLLLVASSFALCWTFSPPEDASYVRNHYTKYEYRIPMRDGVKLYTIAYVPKDRSRKYPIILTRTPYSIRPYGPDNYIEDPGRFRLRYFQEGYIVAYQDVRGRYMSEGTYVNVRPVIENRTSEKEIDETTDTYDTVDWLVKKVPDNNGRVGISGISYPGFYSSMGAIHAHPAVKAVSPQAPVSKWMGGDDWFHNGAFLVSHAFNFYIKFGWPRSAPTTEPDPGFDHGTADGYQFFKDLGPLPNVDKKYMKGQVTFWDQIMNHGTWDDFWRARNILPHLRNVKPAMMVVGGWFDTENLFGALHTYKTVEKNNPNTFNVLVMGPWSHGEWARNDGQKLGSIDFGSKTSDYFREHLELPFFNHYLKGRAAPELAEATVFDTGAHHWRRFESWPPHNASSKSIYLQSSGSLSFDSDETSNPPVREYVSDPSKPVPYTAQITNWYDRAFMLEDQRFAGRRPDVLVYQTPVLQSDITLAGPITADLFVSTSGTDSDWVVKVIDVFPNDTANPEPNPCDVQLGGYEMLVRGDVLRGKFRNSLSQPEPFVPNQVTKVAVQLQDAFHTFKKGHRIMVQLQSSWFPMIDLNPQKFEDIFQARAEDFQKATQRVYSTSQYPSRLEFNVLQ